MVRHSTERLLTRCLGIQNTVSACLQSYSSEAGALLRSFSQFGSALTQTERLHRYRAWGMHHFVTLILCSSSLRIAPLLPLSFRGVCSNSFSECPHMKHSKHSLDYTDRLVTYVICERWFFLFILFCSFS